MGKRTAAIIQKEIEGYEEVINSKDPADNFMKESARESIMELKEELANLGKAPAKAKKPAGKAKKTAAPKVDIKKDLDECAELVKANRKPRAEPVHHNRETRFTSALSTITNVLLEGHEEDPEMVEKVSKAVTRFEMKCKEDFLGLKRSKPSPKIEEKLETAAEKAAA